jgi:hypothetical protein
VSQFFSGESNQVIKCNIDEPVVVICNNLGNGHFAATGYNKKGEYFDLLSNNIGIFTSEHFVGVPSHDSSGTIDLAMIEVKSQDPWTIEIKDLDECELWDGSPLSDSGSKVMALSESLAGSILNFDHKGQGNFIFFVYDKDTNLVDAPVITSGDFTGSALIKNSSKYLFIKAADSWTIST